MSTLHTVNKPPSSGLFASCTKLLQPGDAVLFIEDGVYCGLDSALNDNEITSVRYFSLKEDTEARGLNSAKITKAKLVNTLEFVKLCERYDKILSWF